MNKLFLFWGSLIGALGVAFGALGAHALKTRLLPEQLQIFETGVKYQMYHSIMLVILFLIGEKVHSNYINYSGWCFIFGTLLFSGSIYLLACKELLSIESWKSFLGPITPIGGILLITGWVFLILSSLKSNKL
jgi:uncharacterized membrane protein YgdD (TMEM256/DUF423 family)